MNVQDRVTEMRLVPADQLIANPANWRRHPQAQQRALAAVLDEVGFAGAVIAREDEDGGLVIIDGHARAEMVGEATVPVLVTDLTEAEADVVLATYDPIGAMADRDAIALQELTDSITTQSAATRTLLDAIVSGAKAEIDEIDLAYNTEDDAPANMHNLNFMFTASQYVDIKAALRDAEAKSTHEEANAHKASNALALICREYLNEV